VTEFAKGQRLCARFLLVEVLGQGAWGQLWRAIDEQRSLQIALKVLPLPSADSPRLRGAQEEARIAARAPAGPV